MGDMADLLIEQEINKQLLTDEFFTGKKKSIFFRRKPSITWVTKEGKKLKLSKMTVQHLKNSIAMLRREGRTKHIHFLEDELRARSKPQKNKFCREELVL